ncbi:hypothetical protein HK099_002723, partial [Clydaea vesicula]
GGCQSKFSSPIGLNTENAACFQDRPSIKAQKCISGVYDFGPSTWVINTEAWNGDVNQADFTVDNDKMANIELGQGNAKLWLRPSNSTTTPGFGVRVSSTSYLLYGTFSVKLLGGAPAGMVTTFISMSDVKDEIDWEFTGGLYTQAQTNIFNKLIDGGDIDYSKGQKFPVADWSTTVSEYTIAWSQTKIDFLINGQLVRTYDASAGGFPNTPSRVQFAVWDGANGQPEGTRSWSMGGAPGYLDWGPGGAQGYSASISQVTIQCADDPVPVGPPVRPEGYKAPTLKDKSMNVAVYGLTGSDYFPVGRPAEVVTQPVPGPSSTSTATQNNNIDPTKPTSSATIEPEEVESS